MNSFYEKKNKKQKKIIRIFVNVETDPRLFMVANTIS